MGVRLLSFGVTDNLERYRHEAVELTVGQLREALAGLPDEAPARIDVPRFPRSGAMRDSVDSGTGHFVVSRVVADHADFLVPGEVVLQADFCSEWYLRRVEPPAEG